MKLSEMRFGFDVSYAQSNPGNVPYEDDRVSFAIAKASEGAKRDGKFAAHVSAIRAANKALGAYHFFRPDVDVQAQWEAFDSAAAENLYGHEGDIVPAIDVEDGGGGPVKPAWCGPLKELCDRFEQGYGAKPLLYMGGYTWVNLGRPAWVADYPLWVPMYWRDGLVPGAALSTKFVPCGRTDWSIWQRYVGPAFGTVQASKSPVALDQNWAQTLPLITGR